MMRREAFDLERDGALKCVRDYAVGSVGVDCVRNVRKRVWGGASEDSEISWHDQRDCDVGVAATGRRFGLRFSCVEDGEEE